MATFVAIRNRKQTPGALKGVLHYISQTKKICNGEANYLTGLNCVPQSALQEMLMTKRRFHKEDGRQFYHFVQSFSDEDNLTPAEVNAMGRELAEKEFPGYEVVVATHLDGAHLHNHIVVNSVSCETGKKLHQNKDDLMAHRRTNDEICLANGLNILPPSERNPRKKRMKPGEYQAGLRSESWKLELIKYINEALEYADNRENFIANMELEGYQVIWTDSRKHITFITPEGRRCRDSGLHDETLLKENLETLFAYRQAMDFRPATPEPEEGWLGEMFADAVRLGASLERAMDVPPCRIPHWTEGKQRQREALKKLAHGQKLESGQDYDYDLSM